MKYIVFPISALILGISVIISASLLNRTDLLNTNVASFQNASKKIVSVSNGTIMTKKQLSDYLQVSENSIEDIINSDVLQKEKMGGSYDTYMFLPYLIIDNQKRFLKAEIDKWLKYQNDNRFN